MVGNWVVGRDAVIEGPGEIGAVSTSVRLLCKGSVRGEAESLSGKESGAAVGAS